MMPQDLLFTLSLMHMGVNTILAVLRGGLAA
jgi:hypothetical protein